MPTWRWKFTDLKTSQEHTLEVNPHDRDRELQKNFSTRRAVAPDGQAIIFQGEDALEEQTWTGKLHTQEQYEDLVDWYRRPVEIQVIDELARTWKVYIQRLSLKQAPWVTHPWRHEWTMTVLISDAPD